MMGALLAFWLSGSFVDSILYFFWKHAAYADPTWAVKNQDIIWLVLHNGLLPFVLVLILKPKFNTVLAFLSAAMFGSVIWDLAYCLITRGAWISADSMRKWISLNGTDYIGLNSIYSCLVFYALRLITGITFFVWLLKRINHVKDQSCFII
jgi:hypothetical protein